MHPQIAHAPACLPAVAEKLRDQLVGMKKSHPGQDDAVKTAFQTLFKICANVANSPGACGEALGDSSFRSHVAFRTAGAAALDRRRDAVNQEPYTGSTWYMCMRAGEEKFRKIKLTNPAIQQRVVQMKGGVEFLGMCGFQKDARYVGGTSGSCNRCPLED